MTDPDPDNANTLSVSPSDLGRLAIRGTAAIRTYTDGIRVLDPASAGITFSSADSSIATVAADGTVTGVASGNTTITISYLGQTITVNVEVHS